MASSTVAAGRSFSALFEDRGDLRQVSRRQRFHRGGETLDCVWLVRSGWIARARAGAGGAEAIVGLFFPGDVIGLDALADGRCFDELTALTEAELLRVPLDAVRAWVRDGGDAAEEIMRRLAADARFLREALFAVGTQSSIQRLTTFVLQTYDRLRDTGQLSRPDQFTLPLTQAQLGGVTGLTSVHINRVLKVLREANLLDMKGGLVRLFDVPGLRKVALGAG